MPGFVTKVRTMARHRDLWPIYARWTAARLTGRKPVVRTANGGSFTTPGRFNDYYALTRQHPGDAEIALFRELMPDGGVVFDVGANMGLYTVMAGRARKLDRIVAFEPMHRYCAAWHENVARNGIANATLIQAAAGDRAGVAGFTLDLGPLHNHLSAGDRDGGGDAGAPSSSQTRVSLVRLDDVADALGIERVHHLKIDVEGGEPGVLRGAAKLLAERRVDCLFVEFIIEFMEGMGEDVYACYDALVDMGYTFHAITPDGRVGDPMDRATAVDGRRVPADAVERDFWGLNVVVRRRD